MSQRLLPFDIEVVTKSDEVTGRAGLPLVLETMRVLGLERVIKREVKVGERRGRYSDAEKIEALVLLMASGGDCLEDIDVLKADAGLVRLLSRPLPSPERLRTFLYEFHDDTLIEAAKQRRPEGQEAYIPEENAALQGLGRVNVELVHRVAAQRRCRRATLDHDATIQESHKKEALWHYKGGRGYQPSVVYWVEQDLVLADEYRNGNVPAGMENLRLIKRAFAALPNSVEERCFRADSACYDEQVLKWLSNPSREEGPKGTIGFTISADMTKELRAVCAAVPDADWRPLEERLEETVACTEVEFAPGNWPKDAKPLRYLALRIRKKQGQLFASGNDTKYLAVVTNREGEPADLIRWHWEKAGTIEQVHDVTKNELAAAVPPCGRFGANAAWFRLSLLAYNVMSAMKALALPPRLHAARPKRLRFSVFTIAGRIVSHAGRLVLRIGEEAERLAGLVEARAKLAALAGALAAR